MRSETPRSELAAALDARLFGRAASDATERAERVRRFAAAIGCSVQLARAILGGRRGLTQQHLQALMAGDAPLLDLPGSREVAEAEEVRRNAERPLVELRGRPPNDETAASAFRHVERVAAKSGDLDLARRVRQLAERAMLTAEAG